MPRISYLRSAAAPDPYGKLKVLFAGKRSVLELTNVKIGEAVGPSHPTVKDRISNPEHMTMEELRRYARALQITREELIATIPQW